MTRVFCLLVGALFVFAAAEASGQNATPRLQVYGGYSLLRPRLPDSIGGGDRAVRDLGEFSLSNVLGWNSGATIGVSRRFGITADISGYYRSLNTQIDGVDVRGRMRAHMFLFGPSYTKAGDRMRPFVHLLAGVGRLHAEGTVDQDHTEGRSTAFAGAVGGGLDFVVNTRLMVRAIQFDYFPVRNSHGGGLTFHNIRWGTGMVVRVGN